MRDFGNGCNVFDRPEEIRRLNQNASRVRGHRLLQRLQINASIRRANGTVLSGMPWCHA